MKYIPPIAGALLGLMFIFAGISFFFHLGEAPPLKEGSAAAMFMGAMMPTGYMAFVKVCELTGGILVAIPKTRNFGLLFLGPVILNILAFDIFIMKGEGLGFMAPICLIAVYLLWVGRGKFAALSN